MSIIKACNIENTPKNTGKQCDVAMVATAMLIAMQQGLKFTDSDLEDPVGWLTTLIHQKKAFPLFGQKAPIREINNEAEADQIVTLDDGLKVFLRYGVYNRNFATTSGGLCYAQALQSFLNSGYDILEVDQQGQMLARKNSDGTYSALFTDFMYSPAPTLPDFKSTPFKNRFSYSFSPVELVQNGIIFKGASALLSMMGLIDAAITIGTGTQSTTKLYIGVQSDCAEEDLVAKFGASLGTDETNFKVEDSAVPGVAVTPSAAAIVSGEVELTGTFTSGHKYKVWGADPTVWLANDIEGYDASGKYAEITIP